MCVLQLSLAEAANIARCFKSKDFTLFMINGIMAEGTTHTFLREDDGKVALGKRRGMGAITMQSSKTAIVIAHTREGGQQGNTNKGVGVIADYLEEMNMWIIIKQLSWIGSVITRCYNFHIIEIGYYYYFWKNSKLTRITKREHGYIIPGHLGRNLGLDVSITHMKQLELIIYGERHLIRIWRLDKPLFSSQSWVQPRVHDM